MALQKPRKSYERKPREVKDGKFASGKKAGRPTNTPGEAVRSVSFTLPPSQIAELRTIARIHFRGSMSACLTKLVESKMPEFWRELEAEWEKKDAARPHVDLQVKKNRAKKVEPEDDDLGFVVT